MPSFSKTSLQRLSTCHPLLQKIMHEAIKETDFTVICGHRSRTEQDRAFRQGKSKVQWPNSKHNSIPSRAIDIAPYPVDWGNIKAFDDLAKVILRIAESMNIPLRWGGDFNRDGNKTINDAWDKPHFELIT